jgi:hypothetical protein
VKSVEKIAEKGNAGVSKTLTTKSKSKSKSALNLKPIAKEIKRTQKILADAPTSPTSDPLNRADRLPSSATREADRNTTRRRPSSWKNKLKYKKCHCEDMCTRFERMYVPPITLGHGETLAEARQNAFLLKMGNHKCSRFCFKYC